MEHCWHGKIIAVMLDPALLISTHKKSMDQVLRNGQQTELVFAHKQQHSMVQQLSMMAVVAHFLRGMICAPAIMISMLSE